MDKRFWAAIGVIVIVFGGVYYLTNAKNKDEAHSNGTPTNHIEGNTKSKVTLVEYGDYQCPICGTYYPVVKQVVDKYKDDIQFQFRNFPLTSIHNNAFAAARAAEAAGLQNKYWEMHNMLYVNQTNWSSASDPLSVFSSYASSLKLDTEKFKTDYASSAVNDAINADLADAKAKNLTGTPAFFLNGQQVQLNDLVQGGQPTLAKFSSVLDPVIKANPPAKTSEKSDQDKATQSAQ